MRILSYWSTADGAGVQQMGRIVQTWWGCDCGGLMGAHEAAREFAYEFGGEVVPLRR